MSKQKQTRGFDRLMSDEEIFWAKVRKMDSCWIWLGHTDKDGYGILCLGDKRKIRAHRYSYSLVKSLTPGLVIDHLCQNRYCVNPEHLEEVTQNVNCFRSTKKRWNK